MERRSQLSEGDHELTRAQAVVQLRHLSPAGSGPRHPVEVCWRARRLRIAPGRVTRDSGMERNCDHLTMRSRASARSRTTSTGLGTGDPQGAAADSGSGRGALWCHKRGW